MSRRRVQRSVRVSIAGASLLLSGALVTAAVATATWVSAAAVVAFLAGLLAATMLHAEVVQTRRLAARERSRQAKEFGATWARQRSEHIAFTAALTVRRQQQDRTIRELTVTARLAERRAAAADERVERESRRADQVQTRLSELLDAVLVQQSDLPAIIDLMAWEERSTSTPRVLRREA